LMRCALMATRYRVVADRQQSLHEVYSVHFKACRATLNIFDEEQPHNRAAPYKQLIVVTKKPTP
jgi:hypothetical protein